MIPLLPWASFGAIPAAVIGDLAADALLRELAVYPKPGLVSPVDAGSHADMDAGTFCASAETLRPFFARLFEAGEGGVGLDAMRAIGVAAERAMLATTRGVNTHRGAIFGLGLLCAAAGALRGGAGGPLPAGSLGEHVRRRWGDDILRGSIPNASHGTQARRRYGAGGARCEAADGFSCVYRVALPALRVGRLLAQDDENAAGVHACFALVSVVHDTNLLYRGGRAGLRFAQHAAQGFLDRGSVEREDWRPAAVAIHRQFVARWLSPGGSADLLAMALFIEALESTTTPLAADERANGYPFQGSLALVG